MLRLEPETRHIGAEAAGQDRAQYAQAYAARAIPLGAALLFSLASRRKWSLLPLLTVVGRGTAR
ncbi:hypothetical protein ACQPXH_18785 [Nocardia sp. CA-135953]|uniref:hypothetical protein n=1 Tax=Nocardia sp. CA-135953 TaxID=3239978 RepID=UPI003D9586F4